MKYFVLLTLFLAGCAATPTDPLAKAPVCTTQRQCDVYWQAASMWIRHALQQTVAERTDTMMRTVLTQSPGNYLSARVTREQVARGTWRIDIALYCAMKIGCDPSPWEAQQDFNRYVNQSWVTVD